jgi:hypothetical protein
VDPNAALEHLRLNLADWERYRTTDEYGTEVLDNIADEIATAAAALDDWMSKGGFPPRDWSHGTPATAQQEVSE